MAAIVLVVAATVGRTAPNEIVIAQQCDLTGPTQSVGVYVCAGYREYVALVNSKGGIEGVTIRALEIDDEHRVPPALAGYERMKGDGAVVVGISGWPQMLGLVGRLASDRVPGTAAGVARATFSDGRAYPYVFPLAPSSWSQAAAAVKFVENELRDLKGKKIALLYSDDPEGREPIPCLQELAAREGFRLGTFAVPAPGVEFAAQVNDLNGRFRPDYAFTHLFGRAPAVAIREFKRVGFPLQRVIGLAWGSSEGDIEGGGGFTAVQGYHTIEFVGVGDDYPVLDQIREMHWDRGENLAPEMAATALYNRGVAVAALQIEAVRRALAAKKGAPLTGDDVRQGFEKIKGFTLDGMLPPLEITPRDHEGGGWVRIYRVKGGKWDKRTDWFRAYRDVVAKYLKEAGRAK